MDTAIETAASSNDCQKEDDNTAIFSWCTMPNGHRYESCALKSSCLDQEAAAKASWWSWIELYNRVHATRYTAQSHELVGIGAFEFRLEESKTLWFVLSYFQRLRRQAIQKVKDRRTTAIIPAS